MTSHSILRENKNSFKKILKNKINLNNQTASNIDNQLSNIVVKNHRENFRNFQGNGEVFFNFDKKKFIKNINGMTKFFIALGTLDSRYDEEQVVEKKRVLHYIHIPTTIPIEENIFFHRNENENKNENINSNNNFDNNKNHSYKKVIPNRRNSEFTSIKNLVPGDTFLLHSNWIESQQSEILFNNENYQINEANIHDSNNTKKINQNEKLFISGKINNNKNKKFLKFSDEEIKKVNDLKLKLKIANSTRYLRMEGNVLIEETKEKEKDNGSMEKNDNTVCVKYMGNIGGLWPTPQARTCHSYRTYHFLFDFILFCGFFTVKGFLFLIFSSPFFFN